MTVSTAGTSLKNKWTAAIRRGTTEWDAQDNLPQADRWPHLVAAACCFSEAWAVADTACAILPARDLGVWDAKRDQARRLVRQANGALGELLVRQAVA